MRETCLCLYEPYFAQNVANSHDCNIVKRFYWEIYFKRFLCLYTDTEVINFIAVCSFLFVTFRVINNPSKLKI